MEIVFDKEYLAELYYKGKCSDKKHRFQPQVIRKYVRVVTSMAAVESVDDLARNNGLNYEMLKGDKKGIESVRINDQYRVEFRSKKIVEEQIVTICNILDLSNHYK